VAAQLIYVIFATGMFSDAASLGHSLDLGLAFLAAMVFASACEHLGVEPGWLDLFPNVLDARLDGEFAMLGLCEGAALAAAAGIAAHRRYWPRPEPAVHKEPFDAWQTATRMRGKRCTTMLWQQSNMSREQAIARAEADPACVALMFSTKNNRAADGRRRGQAGWYQGGGGAIATLSNDDWDTIVRPGCEESLLRAPSYSPLHSTTSWQEPRRRSAASPADELPIELKKTLSSNAVRGAASLTLSSTISAQGERSGCALQRERSSESRRAGSALALV